MDRRHDVTLAFTYPDERRARTVAESVRVEEGAIADDRSAVRVERDGRTVRVTVAAADLVALRAGVNTWTRLVGVAERVADCAA
ncbi:KEOPS complex subunit Pcc1 [Halogeometricum rufum]|uniref:KEOPS complex subunit Pcc1 n=1 Tax=Halogeometricum rufum TaxID=553469 RepID=A0A1I6GC88_9EURY|nr:MULTISPECIES: KEOPS complex subunit Pcc1 [Halogeometricum]MUV58446.1 KEOPS complex Pcc1-like subunit [Halogeometricum sp. CBA1124]SFR39687.1 KEOPS complex subunit Pcc1 [Halogeometricum rufum]